MPFLFTFLSRNSSSTKSTSSSFFLSVTNHDCTSWKLLLLLVAQYKRPWLTQYFHLYIEVPPRRGKYPTSRASTKPHQFIKPARTSNYIISLVFCNFSCVTYWNGLKPMYLKAKVLGVLEKVWTVVVWYLLLGICILVYSYKGCGTSKIYLCLEDNRSSFFRVSLKSETKDAHP